MSTPAASVPPAAAANRSVGHSVTWMTVGTVMIGLSGYVFLSVIGHDRFDSATAAALSSTYLLINILGPGVFQAIEQETSRMVSHLLAIGRRPAPGIRRMLILTGVLTAFVLLLIAALSGVLLSQVLGGDLGLLACLGLSVVGSAMAFVIRGVFGGQSRFGRYATTLVIDGGFRLLGCVLLALVGSRSPWAYAGALAVGPVLAALVMVLIRPGRRTATEQTGPSAAHPGGTASLTVPSWSDLSRGILWLLISSVLWMSMSNLAPVIVTATLPTQPAVAAGFATALVLTRVPLLLMAPIQALFLPRLARAAAIGDAAGFRRDLVRGLLVVLLFGLAAIVGFATLGEWAITILFGVADGTTGAALLALLALSSAMLMAILLVQPALVVLRRSGPMVGGWVLGMVVFLGCLWLVPGTGTGPAVWAQLTGPLVTLAIHLGALRRAIGSISPGEHTREG